MHIYFGLCFKTISMKRYIYLTLIWAFLSIQVTLAQNYYYAPTLLCNPVLQQKNSIYSTISWVRMPNEQGLNLNYAHALSKHFFVEGNALVFGPSSIRNLEAEGVNYKAYDFGGGYYNAHDKGCNSILASVSYGNIFNTYTIDDAYSDLDYLRFSIQPNLHIKKNGAIVGISLRVNYLRFLNGGDVVSKLPDREFKYLTNLENKGRFVFPEFGITLGFHLTRRIAVGYQFVYNVAVPSVYNFGKGAGYINLSYTWGPAKDKKRK